VDADSAVRERIRDAALHAFAKYGFEQASIRGIARAAGVSPGVVRRHFGPKDALRHACDEYAVEAVREYACRSLSLANDGSTSFTGPWNGLHPYRQYIVRALIDGSEAAAEMFDIMLVAMEDSLREADRGREDPPVADLKVRAALLVSMGLGIPAFRPHIERVLGTGMYSAQGDRRIMLAILDIHSHPMLRLEKAIELRELVRGEEHGTG
jgi:AcrR family transcriptional regulator